VLKLTKTAGLVARKNDGTPSTDMSADTLLQPVTATSIERRKRLIQQPQSSIGQQQAGQRDTTLLSGRERTDGLIFKPAKLNRV
jgi:hypothetical protein